MALLDPECDLIPSELIGRVAVTGAGITGLGVAHLMALLSPESLLLIDDNLSAATDTLNTAFPSGVPATTAQGVAAIENGEIDIVITSPGWRPDSPVLARAAQLGIPVIGDVELAWRVDRAGVFGPPRTWLGVTGTNGKTTTTAMLEKIMQADGEQAGYRARAVGNIGVAPCDAVVSSPRIDVVVIELSSFQLHWTDHMRLDVGVLLNLADDHLDWHGGFAAYAADKARVLSAAHVVAGIDNEFVAQQLAGCPAKESAAVFSQRGVPGSWGIDDGMLHTPAGVPVIAAREIDPPGPAGVADALAAAAAAAQLGVEPETIAAGLKNFRVAEHRGEVVHVEADGTRWVDNSKATNPHAADAALAGFDNVVWVAGGQLKGASVEELVDKHSGRLRGAVVLGEDRDIIHRALAQADPNLPVYLIDDTRPKEAMEQAVSQARQIARPGDVVLLAPAAASLDMYRGMAQRGELFAAFAKEGSGV